MQDERETKRKRREDKRRENVKFIVTGISEVFVALSMYLPAGKDIE